MAKVSYASLKIKTNTDVHTVQFNNMEIEVLQYLPVEDKYDLIMIALQKAEENGIYNELKLDMFFHLNLVYLYTNLSFTEKQKENESKLYDCIKSSGLLDNILNALNEDEYDELYNMLMVIKTDSMKYKTTAAAILSNFTNSLPKNAEAAAKIVENFDPEKFKQVINFAEAVGAKPLIG